MEPETSPKDTRLIREITLRNILSFGPDTPPFELRPLNVLIGANGSGKSNLISAIEILRATPGDIYSAIRNVGGSADLQWKGSVGSGSGRPSIEVSVNLWLDDELGFIFSTIQNIAHKYGFMTDQYGSFSIMEERITALFGGTARDNFDIFLRDYQGGKVSIDKGTDKRVLEDVKISSAASILNLLKDSANYPEITELANSYSKVRIFREWNMGLKISLRMPQRADMPNDKLEEDFSNLGLYLNRLKRNVPAKKAVLKGLQDLDDFDVKVEGGTVQVFFTEGDWIIPATRLSDGTLRYLCLLAILCDPEPPPLICIEEPELGLHPDILPGLADLLVEASKRTQLIVTTHSEILVDAMSEHPEDVIVFDKHDGQTEMTRYEKDDLKEWLEEYRLGRLWAKGVIGGNRW